MPYTHALSLTQVADTQQVGADIIETLGVQREQLTGAVQTQNEMESVLTRSSNLIKRMLRRADMIKLTLWLIVFALLCTIVGIALYRWGPNAHGKHSPSPPAGPQQPLGQASASAASAAASAVASAAASAAAKAAPSSPLASAGRRLQERRRLNEVRPLGGGASLSPCKRYGEIWGDMGRLGEIWGGASLSPSPSAAPRVAALLAARAGGRASGGGARKASLLLQAS